MASPGAAAAFLSTSIAEKFSKEIGLFGLYVFFAKQY